MSSYLSPKVIERLGHYVYIYLDPRDNSVFYVGKGRGDRCLHHLNSKDENSKAQIIKSIRSAGLEPRIDILVHALPSEQVALQVEAAAIDLLGKQNLSNNVGGWNSRNFGRMELDEIISIYDARPVKITEKAILIRINQLFRYGMSSIELYDATRGIWKVGANRKNVCYAFSVFQGIVREVYKIIAWFPAGSTLSTRDDVNDPDRWEFIGNTASEKIRKKYINGSVTHYLKKSQNPIAYVNVK